MDTLKTVIFIDGQNFRNSLRNFRFRSPQPQTHSRRSDAAPAKQFFRLEEQHFMWQRFFPGVIEKFDENSSWKHQLLRVYWYGAAQIEPFSGRSPWATNTAQKLATQGRSAGLTQEKIIELASAWYNREKNYFEKTKTQFEKIQRNVDFLEFKYVGQYNVRPLSPHKIDRSEDGIRYLGTQLGEKGVDVGIAVDMIAKSARYDAAILISGDGDFMPLVGYLKDKLKIVYQFSLAKGVPPKIKYLSPWLKGRVDRFAAFTEKELLSQYLDRESRIPRPILEAIDLRIDELNAVLSNDA